MHQFIDHKGDFETFASFNLISETRGETLHLLNKIHSIAAQRST